MAQVSFVSVNTASQFRSNRIPQLLWNEHTADIVREYRLGGRQGVARALQWLEEQQIPGLAPTYVRTGLSNGLC
jgi:hypothetical protein